MELRILGSSSAGNGYLLVASDGEALLLEAGFPPIAVKRAIEYKVSDISACLITHEHGDHSKYVSMLLDETAIPIYMSEGTREALETAQMGRKPRRRADVAKSGQMLNVGNFSVIPIECSVTVNGLKRLLHDAAEPMCYIIDHPEAGRVLFATDLYCLPSTRFEGISHLLVECNYDPQVLKENFEHGRINRGRMERAYVSHMSVDTLCQQLMSMDLKSTKTIVLLHGSADNGNPEGFVRKVTRTAGITPIVARGGLTVRLGIKSPF